MCFKNLKKDLNMCDKRINYGDSVLCVYKTIVLYVPENINSVLYDFDKYELGHKFRRIRNGHMSTLCHIITGYIFFVFQTVLAINSWVLHLSC